MLSAKCQQLRQLCVDHQRSFVEIMSNFVGIIYPADGLALTGARMSHGIWWPKLFEVKSHTYVADIGPWEMW